MFSCMKRLSKNFVSVSLCQVLGGNALQSNISVLLFQEYCALRALIRLVGDLVPICRCVALFHWRITDSALILSSLLIIIFPRSCILCFGMTIVTTACHAGNLTWAEWLNQRLPPLLFSFSARPGLRLAKEEFIPASTIRWDLWPDVDQYVADAVTKPSRHERIDLRVHTQTRKIFSEADCCFVYQSLLANIGSVILGDKFAMAAEEWSRSSAVTQQRTTADINRGTLNDLSADLNNVFELARGNPESGLRADIVLKCTGRTFLVVEMKRPSFFRGAVDQNFPDLVKGYEDKDLRFLDGQRSHVLAQSITQLFRYLVRHEIGYGIISSADLSYLVSRVGDSLRISEGIEWHDPKFIGALAYFMEKAADDTTPYVWGGGNGGKHSQDCDIVVSQETQDASSDDEEYGAPKKLKMTPAAGSVTRSMRGKICWKETPAAHLHLEAYPFATGWSGNIVRGIYEGHVVAVKLAVVCSDRAEALINEASAYLKLQEYWGKYVPALISHGTTVNGNVVYVATELIKGFELGMERLTPEVVTASFEALTAIHASGMLHGDIRRENILVPKGGRRGVRFIDFGFARSVTSADDCCEELAQLQYIVSKLPFRGSVRVASTAGVIDRGRHLEAEAYQNLP
uniref:Protein kinase domain-containing protein n=1 Tax=Physcomitrium patens TaxID=3218 RepID=A0A7I4D8Z5_PHYPA